MVWKDVSIYFQKSPNADFWKQGGLKINRQNEHQSRVCSFHVLKSFVQADKKGARKRYGERERYGVGVG